MKFSARKVVVGLRLVIAGVCFLLHVNSFRWILCELFGFEFSPAKTNGNAQRDFQEETIVKDENVQLRSIVNTHEMILKFMWTEQHIYHWIRSPRSSVFEINLQYATKKAEMIE